MTPSSALSDVVTRLSFTTGLVMPQSSSMTFDDQGAVPDSSDGFSSQQPSFHIGKHDSARDVPLTDLQYGHLLNQGVSDGRFIQAKPLTRSRSAS